MSFRRTIVYISGILSACGLAAPQAGAQTPACTLVIEINALRGGSPTVTVGETKNITAKARILKGTALPGTTIDTTLQITALDGSDIVNAKSASPITLEIGKGGDGDTLAMNITQCLTGSIEFVATFSGLDGNGALCQSSETITKTCQ
jgi:hypothetical protein